ncbi:hypothetical protein PX52LOC_06740 [Limnoglobus roseus]|uniref:Uncharacterized protein n=2 Tax=Limnoglobus roseus TaxID=2598579 RepID=A0A5C1ANG7_9BACT|nr:hypothetical protein PX52LOC_06740 [Limnoglobus roseus]
MLFLGSTLVGQDAKKDGEKPKDPTATKVKGQLPSGWAKIGLTDQQKQKVYTIDAKYDDEIAQLTEKIKEFKDKKKKEQLEVLTAEQKKRLEDNLKKSAGTDKDK